MSSAFYPLGMNSYNNRLPQGGYVTWKGGNPVGITSGTIRPLTNKDVGNNYPAPFGQQPAAPGLHCRKPRPIKHARKGSSLLMPAVTYDDETYQDYINVYRNLNREVKSSSQGTLVKQMIDNPGSFSVTDSKINNPDQRGICVVSGFYPNKAYLTENPEPISTTPTFCCNAEKKARRRVVYASTNLKKNYFTTLEQYRQNRCQTYEQRVFNFVSSVPTQVAGQINNPNAKPGGPLATSNTYVANCQPNGEIALTSEVNLVATVLNIIQQEGIQIPASGTIVTFQQLEQFIEGLSPNENAVAKVVYDNFLANPYSGMPLAGPDNLLGCKLVVYKPNNYQFAQQGAVTASTLTLKKNVVTIEKNLYNISKNNQYVFKNKAPHCDPALYTYQQNPTTCSSIVRVAPKMNPGFWFKRRSAVPIRGITSY